MFAHAITLNAPKTRDRLSVQGEGARVGEA